MANLPDDRQLWSWVDRDAPELAEHLTQHPEDRARVERIRAVVGGLARETAPPAAPLPDRIGPWVIRRLLGEGGMGLVYEGERDGHSAAVKVLRHALAGDPSAAERFRREAAVLERLDHPGIARILEAGAAPDGRPYLAMELVPGRPLHEHLRDPAVSRAERLRLLAEVAEAAHAAHEQGIVHRDLKPSNVQVGTDGRARVLDFGLARIVDGTADAARITGAGAILGTPRYMSPEQVSGRGLPVDRRTDVYALGAILYEALTGRPPFAVEGKSVLALVRILCEETPLPPDAIDRTISPDLCAIVVQALEKDPARRQATAAEFARDLRCVLAGRRPAGARRRSLRRVVVALALLLLAAVAASLLALRR